MSTRASISYAPDHHLYQDVMDGFSTDPRVRDRLWLELEEVEFTVEAGAKGANATVTVELPPAALKALRAHLCDKAGEAHEDCRILQEAAAHLVWCVENELTDPAGAAGLVKKLIPADALERFNRRWSHAGEE